MHADQNLSGCLNDSCSIALKRLDWTREHSAFSKGACTNDVSREGEGGGYPNSDGRRGRLRDLYSNNSNKGGEGVKNPENLADVICEWPPTGLQ